LFDFDQSDIFDPKSFPSLDGITKESIPTPPPFLPQSKKLLYAYSEAPSQPKEFPDSQQQW
jgi:hypothetical protein